MTKEERDRAIRELQNSINVGLSPDIKSRELAIEALKAEPCGDCIDRKHLLNEIADLTESPWFNRGKDDLGSALHYGYVERKEAVEIVRDLCVKAEPSVTPARKPGKWILHPDHDAMECSECGSAFDEFLEADYCPHCGADMRVNPTYEIFMGMIKNGKPEKPKHKWIAIQHFEHPEGRDDEDTYYYNQCPNCKKVYDDWDFNFCPNCGEDCSGEGDET